MPPTCRECHPSGALEVTSTGARLPTRWVVEGTMSRVEAYATVRAATPRSFGGLVRSEITGDEEGGGVTFFDVVYSTLDLNRAVGETPTEPTAPGEDEALTPTPGQGGDPGQSFMCSFDTSAQQVHVTQSRSTRHSIAAAGAVLKDFKKAIGVDGERVNGVDIYAPGGEFSIKVEVPFMTLAKFRQFQGMVGTTNDRAWWTFGLGTLLYLGGPGEYTTDSRWSLTHKFLVGKFQQNIDVGNGITIPDKYPWEYLWCRYGPDAVGGAIGQVPTQANVEVVYGASDFRQLNLGG